MVANQPATGQVRTSALDRNDSGVSMPSSGMSVQDTWLLTQSIGAFGNSPWTVTSKGRALLRRAMKNRDQRCRRAIEWAMPKRSNSPNTLAMPKPSVTTISTRAIRAYTRNRPITQPP
ncbi:hypothetical protein D3C75_812760 [compost metagenome]